MDVQRLFEWVVERSRTIRILMLPILVILIGGVYTLVYVTGGIKYVYSHSAYIPVLLSGIVFGTRGGIFFGLLAGLVLGPFMPIDVATGEPQAQINWIYRTMFFILIGFLSGVARDVAKSYIKHLKWLSLHDISTKLPNLSALFENLAGLAREKSTTNSFTLVTTSMANRMELKSSFGFAVIESAIKQMAERFGDNLAERHVYRTDTGQLAVLLIGDAKDADKVLDELAKASKQPILFNEIPIHVDMRMGHVKFDKIAEAPEVYLRRAEAALNEAYEREREHIAYGPEMMTVADENVVILGELEEAITSKQLSLHYQPKVGIANNNIYGAEALVRWNHPERGNIPPRKFIPRAEHSTLIHLLAEFVLDQSMGQIVKWQKDGIDIPISVNISPQNLIHPGFTDLILRLLDRHGLGGEKLELEVTERALMSDMDHAIGEMARLAGAKLAISIDDFGTGYSSLQYLHRLPISLIKIDQSFVRRLPYDKGAAYIVDAAVALAHKMGMKALAEGIEDRKAIDFLEDIGCNIAQGFLISRPLPVEKFTQWYKHYDGINYYRK